MFADVVAMDISRMSVFPLRNRQRTEMNVTSVPEEVTQVPFTVPNKEQVTLQGNVPTLREIFVMFVV